MVKLAEYSEPLERAIQNMRNEMARPSNEGKPLWRPGQLRGLLDACERNMNDLYNAVQGKAPKQAEKAAADLANYAWMVADSIRHGG